MLVVSPFFQTLLISVALTVPDGDQLQVELSDQTQLTGSQSVPAVIAEWLASDYSVSKVEGFAQCLGVLSGIFDSFNECVDRTGETSGCARDAARKIHEYACRTYCTCS